MLHRWIFFVLAIVLASPVSWSADDDVDLGNLELKSIDGRTITDQTAKWRVLCFLGSECPVARFYASRLEEWSRQWESAGVQLVGIHSNLHDSPADVARLVHEFQLSFPQVHDPEQSLARRLKATRVPEVVLLDAEGRVRYRGRIDDQYAPGVKRSAVTQSYLPNAIEALLAGAEPPVVQTEPVGCLITFAKQEAPTSMAEVTYCRDVAPVFNRHCVECHRPGEIGTFDITDYREVRGWAEMIVEVVENRRMPPWHADPDFGHFKNQRHMTESERTLLKRWVETGAPYGESKDLPALPQFVRGWHLEKEPDLVVAMRETPYQVPANGTVDYQYFVVDPHLEEDRWVSAAQVVPGNPSVVHHAIVFVRPPDGVAFEGIGWIAAYVPGQRATLFPTGFARKIPAGSKFVFQMHYTPNGKAQEDCSKIGLTFLDSEQVTHEVFTMIGIDQQFEIPPGASNHVVQSRVQTLPAEGMLLSVTPHMHLRGKAFEMTAIPVQSSDSSETAPSHNVLIKVPQYDFNWQHTYEFSAPLPFNDFQSLELTTTFDNSRNNPFNPNADEYVVWGDQTWEEMSVAFLEVARPYRPKAASPSRERRRRLELDTAEREAACREYAAGFLAKFDANGDGVVIFDEAPRIVQHYSFSLIDQDRDGKITSEELKAAAKANLVN